MDHGRGHELQGVTPGAQGIALLDDVNVAVKLIAEELAHHVLRHSAAVDLQIGPQEQQILQLSRVVGLHMVHHHAVQRTTIQGMEQILPELAADGTVHRVEEDGFLIRQQIAVEGNAIGDVEHALKHGKAPAIGADPRVVIVDLSRAIHLKYLPISRKGSRNGCLFL